MRDSTLLDRSSGITSPLTLTEIPSQSGHPILANVPSSFTIPNSGANVGIVHNFATNPATVLMKDQFGNDAVAVRNFGLGHIVEALHNAGNCAGLSTLSDPNVQQLYIDGILSTVAGSIFVTVNNVAPVVNPLSLSGR
ncbi:MAG: hypothetical protein U0905_22350 [Pirellulales bacterium]